ncbi:RsfA family transcriptional regulator [Rossellomorea sp. YZS02]|uniref:RsfA family transcriptional regulator n=1 Tax=Rossellomorea sp. YZS02 TaxID=3097358 RepID=UPI002A17DE19|nr:RsfA family transcriptional regulator [Rossellomorea sp. YZS02]MDX8342990.1 RsfA family transcriptional regulator [Rossellomorea sp. YZS02]
MSSNRQDAWSQDEDVLLAEVVLRHIREGGTQLQAFDEVGKKLSRTSAACGFRWNSFVRKQYKSGIELAKKQRKHSKKHSALSKTLEGKPETPKAVSTEDAPEAFSMGSMIQYLQKAEEAVRNEERVRNENSQLTEQISQLQDKLQGAEEELREYEEKYTLLEEDHKSLLAIFEKARKMALLQGNEDKVKFQMDKNGNLQRLNK